MKIDIDHLCKLARISIAEEKKEVFSKQMEDIVAMVRNLPDCDDDPSFLDENNPMELREDVIKPSLSRDEILAIAPDKQAGCVVVPKIIKEEQ